MSMNLPLTNYLYINNQGNFKYEYPNSIIMNRPYVMSLI